MKGERNRFNSTDLKSDEGPLMELYPATDVQAIDYIS